MTGLDPLTPRDCAHLSPAVVDALAHFRSPPMSEDIDFALIDGEPKGYPIKPTVYASLTALARAIHRRRGDDALEVRPGSLLLGGKVRAVTEIIAVDQRADRRRRIGYAWHAGRSLDALKVALQAIQPNVPDALYAGRVS